MKERGVIVNKFKRILIPLDGSILAETALSFASTLARQFESELILIRIVDLIHITMLSPNMSPSILTAQKEAYEEAESYLRGQAEALRVQGLNVITIVSETSPADDIINAAVTQNVDLIVMSTHGRGGLARWTFGSVADKVVRHSPCPVFIVPPENKKQPETKEQSILKTTLATG